MAKDLYQVNKNDQTVNQVNDALTGLRNTANKKKISEHENPDKVIGILEKIFDFNKQQKDKGLETSTTKRMLQRLPISLEQVKASNTSENLLNEICQTTYF